MGSFDTYLERKLRELIRRISVTEEGDVAISSAVTIELANTELEVGGILDRTGAQSVISNTVTETTLYSCTIPAGILGTDRSFKFEADGAYLNTTGLNRTFILRIKLGGNTYYNDPTPNIATGASERTWDLSVKFKNMDSQSTNRLHGRLELSPVGGTTSGVGDLGAAQTIDMNLSSQGANPNLDMSVDRLFEVTIEHSNADTSIFLHGGILRIE